MNHHPLIRLYLALLLISYSCIADGYAAGYKLERSGFVAAGGTLTGVNRSGSMILGGNSFGRMRSERYSVGSPTLILDQDRELPTAFALWQNYPNPFNQSTTLRYDLPCAGQVRLLVYSVLGEQVAQLFFGWQEAGQYQLGYHGLDQNGYPLSSGIYFISFRSGAFASSIKLVIVR